MRTWLFLLLASVFLVSLAHADPDDLSGGVLLVHAPPGLVYTNETAVWCDSTYLADCEDQVNRIEAETEAVWFVLSAWAEEKTFSAVEFGLGDFETESFTFMADGICLDDAMAINYPSVEDWPGPNTGIALAATGDAWTGQLVPIAWFAGYNYAEADTIAITENPATGHAGWVSGESPSSHYAECMGALGLGVPGTSCMPDSGQDLAGEEPEPENDQVDDNDTGSIPFDYSHPYQPRTVLAAVDRDSLALPADMMQVSLAEAILREDVTISDSLAELFEESGISQITAQFPHFDPYIYDRQGNQVIAPDGYPATVPNDLGVWFVLTLTHDDVTNAVSRLSGRCGVFSAEPIGYTALDSIDDPLFSPRQWNLNNEGAYCGGVSVFDIAFLRAYEAFGSNLPYPVPVGILDTGIDPHPDIAHKVLGKDCCDRLAPHVLQCTDDSDMTNHGTPVAGIIGMEIGGVPLRGGAGIAPCDTMVSIRVLGCCYDMGEEHVNWRQLVAEGIDYARTRGAGSAPGDPIKVINMSFGADSPNDMEAQAIQNACASGMACIAAAGNFGTDAGSHYPSGYAPLVCSVNAFIFSGRRWEDSLLPPYNQVGCNNHCANFGPAVDLTAPGGFVATTAYNEDEVGPYMDFYIEEYDEYVNPSCDAAQDYPGSHCFSGTSAAAPHVTGVVAAVLACDYRLSGEDAVAIVCSTAVDHVVPPAQWGRDDESGWGHPDMFRAMALGFEPKKEWGTVDSAMTSISVDGEGVAYFDHCTPVIPRTGYFNFVRYRVTATVALQETYEYPIAWGRIQNSAGWRKIEDNDTYNLFFESPGYVRIDNASANEVSLTTYRYALYDGATFVDWYPLNRAPAMSYSVVEGAEMMSDADEWSEPRTRAGLVWPTPTQTKVLLSLPEATDGEAARIGVFSADGRLVREIAVPKTGAMEWDLTDSTGRRVSAGVYFVRQAGGGKRVPQRVVVVR